MENNVSPALRDEMLARFALKTNTDPQCAAFYKKLNAEKATQDDVAAYADRLGVLIRDTLSEVLTPEALPNGTLYYNILRDTADVMIRNAHRLINSAAIAAQKKADEAQGIGMRAVSAPYPERRVRDLLYKAGAPGLPFESAMKALSEPMTTLTRSFHDEFIRTNAEDRFHAGVRQTIERRAHWGCCEWCADLAGSYPYEDVRDTGNDVFRRHERCKCTVNFVTDGKRQDVWSKKFFTADEDTLRERSKHGTETGDTSPETLRKRSEYGLEKGVENGGESDIIQGDGREPDFYVGLKGKVLSKEYKEWIGDNEMQHYLDRAVSETAKIYIRSDFRPSSFIGDGSTAAVREFEKVTGLMCGRNGNSHVKKANDIINQITHALEQDLPESDIQMLTNMLNRLKEVI